MEWVWGGTYPSERDFDVYASSINLCFFSLSRTKAIQPITYRAKRTTRPNLFWSLIQSSLFLFFPFASTFIFKMLEKEPKHVSFLFFQNKRTMSPMRCSCRWMFNSKCQHLQVSLSLSHLNGKLIWRRCVLVPSRRPDATCNGERFNCINAFTFQVVNVFHSHNQLGSLTWFTLSRKQIW